MTVRRVYPLCSWAAEGASALGIARNAETARRMVVSVSATLPAWNLLGIDLEDWYQLSGERLVGRGEARADVLERQVDRLLGLLARHRCRATFFCLGHSLEKSPQIVRRIAAAGHELASHGWGHRLICEIGLEAFREDLHRALAWQRDLTGQAVLGHRAPAFSVAPEQLAGFYDICFEAGLRYDSSILPFRARGGDMSHVARAPHVVRGEGACSLIELPLATIDWLGRRRAIAGGGWWRLLPGWVLRAGLRRVNREGIPFTSYFHPYEFDTEPLSARRAAGRSWASLSWGLKQNLGRSGVYGKLDAMLGRHRFCAIEDYLRSIGHL